jgi:soluble lytic murein transglycosylase
MPKRLIIKFWKTASGRKVFLLGLGLGFVVASSSMYWLGRSLLSSEEYEADSSAHLGLRSDIAPIVALRPISTERLSRYLKIKTPEEALTLARVFSERVSAGFLPRGWAERCDKEHHPILCVGLDDYFEAFEARQNAARAAAPPRRGRVTISDGRIEALQGDDLGALLSVASKRPKNHLQKWTQAALKTQACPRNLSIALARMWEYYANEAGSWERVAQLDEHGLECLGADDRNAEYVLLRAGLLAFSVENYEKALEYFGKALLTESRREPYRVNYWMAETLKALGRPNEARSYHEQIIAENPLSWAAIRSYSGLGRDPMAQIREMKPFRDRYFSDNDTLNTRLAWFYLIARTDGAEYAAQRYSELLIESLDSKTPKGVFQHVARVLDGIGQHRIQISVLSRMFSQHRDSLNIETLRLFYPKPFFDEIDASSPNLDTALLMGLVRQESGFDPKARSGANARGLLQVLPTTARDVRRRTPAEMLYDASTNIQIGSIYFGRLVNLFDGSIEKALAAYNAGMGRVGDWNRRYGPVASDAQLFMDLIPYRETREYVSSILRNAYWYHRLFPEMTLSLREGIKSSDLLKAELAEQIRQYVPAPRALPLAEDDSDLEAGGDDQPARDSDFAE